MSVIFHRTAARYIRKSDAPICKRIQQEIDRIISQPQSGKLLDQPFRQHQIRSHQFTHHKNQYRIAYSVENEELVFWAVDSRENFYKKLRHML